MEEPWHPVWEDPVQEDRDAADSERPPWATKGRARPWPALNWAALVLPLAAAEDALSRLDAGAEAASPAVREGLVARLAFAEAAGWLASAAERAWIHPRDLALAEAGLLGDFAAAALGGHGAASLPATTGGLGSAGQASVILAAEADRLPDGATLAQGLALARALRRLASLSNRDPLAAPAGLLQPLMPEGAPPLRLQPERLAAWRKAALNPGLPPLLAAGAAAMAWMEAEIPEDSLASPAQALLLAAAVVRHRRRVRTIPLPIWAVSGGSRPVVLPLQEPRAWPAAFLRQVAAAARRGLGDLAQLRDAESVAKRLTGASRRSLLAAAAEAALRAPALTARGLARQLSITPQGALLLLKRLEAANVVREATGRRSFRAYVVG